MPKKKNIPMRMCIACREMKPKVEMTRVVRNAEGEISPDPTGKAPGRGAYICRDVKCLRRAGKSKRIDRNLECEIPEAVYDAMEEELSSHAE